MLENVWVPDALRRRGIFRALLAECEEYCDARHLLLRVADIESPLVMLMCSRRGYCLSADSITAPTESQKKMVQDAMKTQQLLEAVAASLQGGKAEEAQRLFDKGTNASSYADLRGLDMTRWPNAHDD